MEVGVAERALLEELADDEQRPALAHQVERVCHRAVLAVLLHQIAIVQRVLVGWKS